MGTVIVFGDVVGSYSGTCADYDPDTATWMNREDATVSVIAVNTQEAGVKASCERFDDLQLSVKSSSAAEIIFEKINSEYSTTTLRYLAASDSIVLSVIDSSAFDVLFTGVRQ